VLQDGRFTTVGGRTPIKANVRIIAATHRDLTQLIKHGQFREDLYYRLNVVPIRLPPLRQRSEDIPELVAHFLNEGQAHGLPSKSLSPAAIARMKAYRWPGNVRELENLVKRLLALYTEQVIEANVIEMELAGSAQTAAPETRPATLGATIERHLREYFEGHNGALPPRGLYDRILREMERPLITLTLQSTHGNQIKAADVLGLNRNTLRKKIRELDINVVRGLK
jgi:two-component system nitrogen regulation response regulator GlnG